MFSKHTDNPCGFQQEPLEVGEHGTVRVDPKVNLVSIAAALHDSDGNEPGEFALHRAVPGPGESNDLSQIERPIGVPEEQRQHRLAGLAEERRGERIESQYGRRGG